MSDTSQVEDIIEDICKLLCIECGVNRPVNNIGQHTYRKGGDILLPTGKCRAFDVRTRFNVWPQVVEET